MLIQGQKGKKTMVAFRLIAWILVALALALLGADAVSSLEAGEPVVRTTAEVLELFGFNSGYAVPEGGVGKAFSTVLSLPLWAVVGIIGLVLTLVFRPID